LDRVVRDTFRLQILVGDLWAQTDKPEVDPAAIQRFTLCRARHIEQIQRHAGTQFSECSKRCREYPVMDVCGVTDV
jgi:hypothetical protein